MVLSSLRPFLAAFPAWLALSGAVHAQTPPSLRDAVDAAWALSPSARSLPNRQDELDARARAAASLISGPPSVALSHRSDRVGGNAGLRELEAEVSVPLWSPGVRSATAGQVEADRAALAQQQLAVKARLAAEVRDLAAQAAVAGIEREAAGRKLQEAQLLAQDIERRVRVGEVARIDLLQAQSVRQQAATAQAAAGSAIARIRTQWRALTGMAQVALLDETSGIAQEPPVIAAARAQLGAAQARLALAEADRRDPVEIGLGMTRERETRGAASETAMKISLRVPLGSYGRNAPRLAAARAEVDIAEAELQAAQRTAQAERETAEGELEAARQAQLLAAERERLAGEIQALVAKSWRLGEGDLPTRLRADGERFDAELAHARARVETRRAISRLNQAFGILP